MGLAKQTLENWTDSVKMENGEVVMIGRNTEKNRRWIVKAICNKGEFVT